MNNDNNIININTTPLAHAFYTAAIKTYRY